jgi:FkbM family methyltransferase
MLGSIKKLKCYQALRKRRIQRGLRQWTVEDERLLKFYGHFVTSGDLCFDIGANLGTRTKVFRKLGAVVVAVEPQPYCVSILKSLYGNDDHVHLVEQAVGSEPGAATLHVGESHVLSTLNPEWIAAMKASKRFGDTAWAGEIEVPLTTIDALVETYGSPAFAKIDVEGYELEVLRGASSPLQSLSLEFAPEFLDRMVSCIEYLTTLGDYRFNHAIGEPDALALDVWVSTNEMIQVLSAFRGDHTMFGDVYARVL